MTTSPAATAARLPAAPGVYRFRDQHNRVLYIGRATDLRRRVPSYWRDVGDRPWLARMVPRIARIEAVACDSAHEAAWLERNLLERQRPPWNRAIGGQEVPVLIRVDTGPSTPGVTVVHDPPPSDVARYFGPYLGGTRVRLAVSALCRLLPVAYASDRLSGSSQDLARVLGVEMGDREALLATLVAVLERDPVAVKVVQTALERRRDEATETLAFERAAQVHAAMAAIEWVVAEQKVATLEPRDLDIHGWADGILVSFTMRAGRLSGWEQRRCSEDAARQHVVATPVGYEAFAHRNAALAARMHEP